MNRTGLVLLMLAITATHEDAAQTTVTPDREYAELIGCANAVDPTTSFGEEVNLRDGSFQFCVADIELTGTGPTTRITRTFKPRAVVYLVEGSGGSLREWMLEIPRIKTITLSTTGVHACSPIGWQVLGTTSAEKNKRCTRFSAPDRMSFPSDAARGWNLSPSLYRQKREREISSFSSSIPFSH